MNYQSIILVRSWLIRLGISKFGMVVDGVIRHWVASILKPPKSIMI